LIKVDLHVHTKYSTLDCNTTLEEIITYCKQNDIGCVAIADHGTVEGALKLQAMNPPFKVIVAEEVLTPYGEIMGMFLTKTVPSRQPVDAVLEQISAQGGLVNIPHPFDKLRPSGLTSKEIERIVGQIDIMEAYNSKVMVTSSLSKTRAFADKHGLAKGAGSDAHVPQNIGSAYLEMPDFNTKEEFLAALKQGKIVGRRTLPYRSIWQRVSKFFGK
jgi:predicted metal-dependent phosphoesterase TrpH